MVTRGKRQILEAITVILFVHLIMACHSVIADADTKKAESTGFYIDKARWEKHKRRLVIEGDGIRGKTVTVSNADTTAFIGSDRIDAKEWEVKLRYPKNVPCRIFATQSDGQFAERKVERAPKDCDDGVGGGSQPEYVNFNGSGNDVNGRRIRYSSVDAAGSGDALVTSLGETDNHGVNMHF